MGRNEIWENHVTSGIGNNPRIAFIGTGAQGASVAADFALAGLDVTFIDQWPAHVEAMRAKGLTVNLPTRTSTPPVKALHLCEIAEIKEPFDVVFMVVKAYDTRWAAEMIKPVLAPDGFVVGLQNGMTHEDIAEIVGRDRTIGAVIQIASNMWEPGITTRQNDRTSPGSRSARLTPAATPRGRRGRYPAPFRHGRGVDDIRSAKWMKLVVNAAELIPSAIIDTVLEMRPGPAFLEVDARCRLRGDGGGAGRRGHDHADHRHAAGDEQPSRPLCRPDLREGPDDLFARRHADDIASGLAQGASGRGR